MSILHDIVAAKRDRVAELRRATPWLALRAMDGYAEQRRSLAAALRRGGHKDPQGQPSRMPGAGPAALHPVRFLCEIKRASPSVGEIRPGADASSIARLYREAGASAISLVTEEQFFHGRPADLPAVRAAGLPVLMKDFLVDPWQIGQARSLGADAVLLIVAMNDRPLLEELRATARELELEVLVEVHEAAEIELAWRLAPELCGVNHRNLNTFEVDLQLGERLLASLPTSAVHLAESGIRTRADVVRLEEAGFDALLVGESLMRAADPGAALRQLRGEAAGPASGSESASEPGFAAGSQA
jgi:indole-3-glycerol phosphate synthase